MDFRKITDLLRANGDPNQVQQSQEQLAQVQNVVGFVPSLLQVVMAAEIDIPVRQAGAIYLKKMITNHWKEGEAEQGEEQPFLIHEQDRALIRDALVEAVVLAPALVRSELVVCVNHIIHFDFPGKWTQFADQISIHLQNPEPKSWMGALLCLYQLVKIYEMKKPGERMPLTEAMNILLPLVHQLLVGLLPDLSEQSTLLQEQVLKIFYVLIQHSLPLNLLSKPIFTQWMDLIRDIADRPIPEHTLLVVEKERPGLPWWKCRNWAMTILVRVFERYGSPGKVSKEYKEFASWFLNTFTVENLEIMMRTLDQCRRKQYVCPHVLQETFSYVTQAMGYAFAWKLFKPLADAIIREVLFPTMCYTGADAELWRCDPLKYIRFKYHIFEDFVSPVAAAQTLLHAICKKREEMLQSTMEFLMKVLMAPNADPCQKDGALRMVGSLADILLKQTRHKKLEQLLVQFVYPEYSSPHGHLRARACWVLHHFSKMKFKQEPNLGEAIKLTQRALLTDVQLPVKVEAALALQRLLSGQKERAKKYVEPHIRAITLEVLNIIRETENEAELTNVMLMIVTMYTEQLMPLAEEICQHLVTTFGKVLALEEKCLERANSALGLLHAIDWLLVVMSDMKDHPKVMAQLEPVVLQVVGLIFTQSEKEFYPVAFSLINDLTSKKISPDLWEVLEMICQLFENGASEHFTDMMPALHNYVTVDTQAFANNSNYLLALFNMCKAILTGDSGEDAECHAAKLLEVILLQCKGLVDQCIPSIVELVLARLTRVVETFELKTMCQQVIIAALYTSPNLVLETLKNHQAALGDSSQSLTSPFIRQWIQDTDCFRGLHDRKLCVLGLCTLISAAPAQPGVVEECAQQIVPSLLLLFDGLKRGYAAKAAENKDDNGHDGKKLLVGDEDDVVHEGQNYMEGLQENNNESSGLSPFPITTVFENLPTEDEEEEGSDNDDEEETADFEGYTTPLDGDNCEIDEYIIFKQVMEYTLGSNPAWYSVLTADLTSDQQKALGDIIVLADQRRVAAESRRVKESGGLLNQRRVNITELLVEPRVPIKLPLGIFASASYLFPYSFEIRIEDCDVASGKDYSTKELRDSLRSFPIYFYEDIEVVTYMHTPLSSLQRSQKRVHHAYILLKTATRYCTIEKGLHGIDLQVSTNCETVSKKLRLRTLPLKSELLAPGKWNVREILIFLIKNKVIDKSYNLLYSNCKHFANLVYKLLTKPRQPAIYFPIKPPVDASTISTIAPAVTFAALGLKKVEQMQEGERNEDMVVPVYFEGTVVLSILGDPREGTAKGKAFCVELGVTKIKIVYDEDSLCFWITVQDCHESQHHCLFIALESETKLKVDEESCVWTGFEYSTEDPIRRTFRARFTSKEASLDFKSVFDKCKQVAETYFVH